MVRTKDRDGSIVRRGQPRCRVSTSLHGELAINWEESLILGYHHRLIGAHMVPILPPCLPLSPHPPLTHPVCLPPSHPPPTIVLDFLTPPSTLAPYHPYVPSPPHPSISDPLMHTSSPYVAAHPISYAGIAHHIAALLGPSFSVPYVYHTSTSLLHSSFTSPPQPIPAPFF